MKKNIVRFVIIIACTLMMFGCKENGQTTASNVNKKAISNANNSTVQSETNIKKDGFMIAKVNETTITSAEVEQEINNLMALYGNSVPPDQLQLMQSKMRNQAIETLINKQLLFLEADRKRIQPSSDEINGELNRIISRFPSSEAFYQQLTKRGIPKEQILKDIEQQLRINLLLKESMAGVPAITDEEITAFYQKNSQNFRAKEQVRASHILLKFDSEAPSKVKEQKRQKLAGLRSQIENGADFTEIAAEYSECPSSGKGGDLGFVERGKMVKPFEKAAFSLKAGELSEIIETRFGYHLIKVVERKEARTLPFEEVKDKISVHLKSKQEQLVFNTYLKELRENASIEYIESNR